MNDVVYIKYNPIIYFCILYVSCVCVCTRTCMGKHGVSLLQVRVQSVPVLNEAVLGL